MRNSLVMPTMLQSLQRYQFMPYGMMMVRPRLTFLYEFCPFYTLLDLAFVSEVALRGKRSVETAPEIFVTLGILSSHVQQFCRRQLIRSFQYGDVYEGVLPLLSYLCISG